MPTNRIVQILFAHDYFFYKLIRNAIHIDTSYEGDDMDKYYETQFNNYPNNTVKAEGVDISSFPKGDEITPEFPIHVPPSLSRNLDHPDKRVIKRRIQDLTHPYVSYTFLSQLMRESLGVTNACPLGFMKIGKI